MTTMITSGLSGLIAYQRAIDVAAQNIANANTEGYVRQRVELSTRFAPVDRQGMSVGGVKVDGIRREVNEFLIEQSRTAAATAGRAEMMAGQAEQIMSLLGSTSLGLDDTLQNLKNAFEALATEPASLRARDALVTELESAVDRFKTVDDRLRAFDTEITGRLDNEIKDVNLLLTQVASLNDKLFRSNITTGISPSNVLDERDRLLDKLSFKLGFKISSETNGTITLRSMDNRLLVKGSVAATLSLEDGLHDPSDKRISLVSADGISSDFTVGVAGGNLGGLIDSRAQLTTPTRNEIGRVATALAQVLNTQNKAGLDLDGIAGGDLLSVGAPAVFARSDNVGTMPATAFAVTVDTPPSALTSSDYLITKTAGGWGVTRADTGAAVAVTGAGTVGSPFKFDGLSVVIGAGTPQTNDSFMIRPTHDAVKGLDTATSDSRKIAAAKNELPFGAGDNRNALELSKVFEAGSLDASKTSLMEATSRLANRVGAQARSAQLTYDVQKLAVDESNRQRSDLYGVSLDEEAANLMRFQQAYQASASVIRAANELFDVLLNATN